MGFFNGELEMQQTKMKQIKEEILDLLSKAKILDAVYKIHKEKEDLDKCIKCREGLENISDKLWDLHEQYQELKKAQQ
tara:strand:- start:330 stop:563 length:234 start_codon:yes stop_codon:yes gene_type:complete